MKFSHLSSLCLIGEHFGLLLARIANIGQILFIPKLTKRVNFPSPSRYTKIDKNYFTTSSMVRASDDGGPGGPWPLHFFAKMECQNLLIIVLIFFKTLCSFTFKQSSLHPFDSVPVQLISEISCWKLTTSLFGTIIDNFQLNQNLHISNHYEHKKAKAIETATGSR